ncbi:MAG: hypothetical protein QNJ51_08045 [Calothrix sp. MO_167.B12]|nr:hypothetical protein [Calothrix sp. MO_167.B12]
MSNKRLKIENLENLQEITTEEFSAIQGGMLAVQEYSIAIDWDDWEPHPLPYDPYPLPGECKAPITVNYIEVEDGQNQRIIVGEVKLSPSWCYAIL